MTIETKIAKTGNLIVKLNGKRAKFHDAVSEIQRTSLVGGQVDIITNGTTYTGGFDSNKSEYIFTDNNANEYIFIWTDLALKEFARGNFGEIIMVKAAEDKVEAEENTTNAEAEQSTAQVEETEEKFIYTTNRGNTREVKVGETGSTVRGRWYYYHEIGGMSEQDVIELAQSEGSEFVNALCKFIANDTDGSEEDDAESFTANVMPAEDDDTDDELIDEPDRRTIERNSGNYDTWINDEYVRFENHSIAYIDAERKNGYSYDKRNGRKNFYRYGKKIAAAKIAEAYMNGERAAEQSKAHHEFFNAHKLEVGNPFKVSFEITTADGQEHFFSRTFETFAEAKALVDEFTATFSEPTQIVIGQNKQGGDWFYSRDTDGSEKFFDAFCKLNATEEDKPTKKAPAKVDRLTELKASKLLIYKAINNALRGHYVKLESGEFYDASDAGFTTIGVTPDIFDKLYFKDENGDYVEVSEKAIDAFNHLEIEHDIVCKAIKAEIARTTVKFEVGKWYASDETDWNGNPCGDGYRVLKRTKNFVTIYDSNNDDWHYIDNYDPDDEIPGEFDCIFRKRIQLDDDGNEYVEWKDEEGELVTLSAKKETQDPNPWLRDEEPENNDDTDDKPEDDELIGEPEENTATEETLVAYTREIPQDETFKVREFVIGDELDGDVISFYKDRWIKIYSKTHGATIRRNGFDPDDNRIYFDTKPFYANRQQYLYKEDCTEEEFWRAMVERGVVTVNEPKEPCRPFTIEEEIQILDDSLKDWAEELATIENKNSSKAKYIQECIDDVTKERDELKLRLKGDETEPSADDDPFDETRKLDTMLVKATVNADYMEVTLQGGRKLRTCLGALHVKNNWKTGNGFIITNWGDLYARYDTPEQVETVINMLKAAIERGDKKFTFPTVEELNQPSKDDLHGSLERAAEIARQKYHEYERDGNEAGMLSEIELYSICTDAIKELEAA